MWPIRGNMHMARPCILWCVVPSKVRVLLGNNGRESRIRILTTAFAEFLNTIVSNLRSHPISLPQGFFMSHSFSVLCLVRRMWMDILANG